MKFLTVPECERWCVDRGFLLPGRLHDRPLPSEYSSHEFSIPGQRLLWIQDWSVWPSGEHMPIFTKWRAAFGEAAP